MPPAVAIDDALEAIGYVLLGAGAPRVVCVLDWAAVSGGAHLAWRSTLAEAAGTTPDCVAVQCVHQHNAPFVCDETQALVAGQAGMGPLFQPEFLAACLTRAGAAVRAALAQPRRVTHVAQGEAVVEGVASNRRVARDESGQILRMRKSACDDRALQALPDGLIDPTLQSIAFYEEKERLLVCHYYATHPMSYYRDGRVSSDFCGLARKRRQQADPGCLHLYFSGCAGDVAAGKYNDGTPAARLRLTGRIEHGMIAAEAGLKPQPLHSVEWRTAALLPPVRRDADPAQLASVLADSREPEEARRLAAFQLGWHRRVARGLPLVASSLLLNDLAILHLPGEIFVAYQLRARAARPGRAVAVAAYGDDGLWYVPTREEFRAGGYEVECAFCDPAVDDIMTAAIHRLLR